MLSTWAPASIRPTNEANLHPRHPGVHRAGFFDIAFAGGMKATPTPSPRSMAIGRRASTLARRIEVPLRPRPRISAATDALATPFTSSDGVYNQGRRGSVDLSHYLDTNRIGSPLDHPALGGSLRKSHCRKRTRWRPERRARPNRVRQRGVARGSYAERSMSMSCMVPGARTCLCGRASCCHAHEL